MGKLFVSDTNIFIDLIHMGLLGDFFLLPFDVYTVDFVVRELKKAGQKDAVMAFVMKKRLTVFKFSTAEIEDSSICNSRLRGMCHFKIAQYGSARRNSVPVF